MKITVLCILAVSLLSGCFFGPSLIISEQAIVGRPNLVLNPDFETKDRYIETLPANWLVISSSKNNREVSLDKTAPHKGDSCLRVTNPSTSLLIASDAFPVDYRHAYYCSVNARSLNRLSGKVTFIMRTFDSNGNKLNQTTHNMSLTSNWKRFSFSSGFFKKKVAFARLIVSIPKEETNTIWIDDLGCFEVYKIVK